MTAATQYVLADVADTIAAQFQAHGVPCWVKFGGRAYKPELVTKNEVVIREAQGGDSFADTPRAGGNPQPLWLRTVAAEVEITGRSTAAGATVTTHRQVVTALLHQFMSALSYAEHESGAPVSSVSGGFVDDSTQPNEYGARYLLKFSVPEVICHATTWAMSTADTGFTTATYMVVGTESTLVCEHEEPPPPPPEEP
jgi:hypothetical protein